MKLRDIGTIITGNTPSKKNKEYYESNDIMFIKPSDIEENYITIIEKTEEYISEKAREKARILPKGAVLVTCIGTIGKVGILNQEATCNQQINAIIPNDKVISKFLAYLIQSKQKILQLKANAPVVPIINKTDFSEIEIYICDIDKQKDIVNQLDLLKAIIDKRKLQIEELQNIIKSQFVEMFGTPLMNEKNYKVYDAEKVCKKITDGAHYSPKDQGYGYPMLSVKNMRNDGFHYENCKYIAEDDYQQMKNLDCVPKKNDILISKDGSYFYYGFVVEDEKKEAILSSIAILRPNIEIVNPYYLRQYMLSSEIVDLVSKNYVTGAALKRVILKGIKKIPIMLPEIKEQNQFAEFVKLIDKQKFVMVMTTKKIENLNLKLKKV